MLHESVVDFDDIESWAPLLCSALKSILPPNLSQRLVAAQPEFVEDARAELFAVAGRDAVIDGTIGWIRASTIVGYHGSRLVEAEIQRVRDVGLAPLKAEHRRTRLVRALSKHPKWTDVAGRLDAEIEAIGPRQKAGGREGQVHLSLSRSGLTKSFNYYLRYGSEFDQHVAWRLFGKDGYGLLERDGSAVLVKVGVPGAAALGAAHPIFSIEDVRRAGDTPNIVSDILCAWAYREAYPGFQSSSLKVDCGMVFRSAMSRDWLLAIERLTL